MYSCTYCNCADIYGYTCVAYMIVYLVMLSVGLLEPMHRYLFPNSVSLMKIEETNASVAVPAVNQNTVFSACSYE